MARASRVSSRGATTANVKFVNGMSESSGFDNGAVVAAAIADLPTHPVWGTPMGRVILPAGIYECHTPIGECGWLCRVEGAGKEATVLMDYTTSVTTGLISFHNPTRPPVQGATGWLDATQSRWAIEYLDGVTIDGTNASAGACGVHIGAGEGGGIGDILVRHYNGVGSRGIWIDCALGEWWIEKLTIRKGYVADCTTAVYATGGATAWSMGYSDWHFDFEQWAYQDGLVLDAGANKYGGSVHIRGNFAGGVPPAAPGAVIAIQGSRNGLGAAGAFSCLDREYLNVNVEGGSGSPGDGYQTIRYETVAGVTNGNFIRGCWGMLWFSSPGTKSNWTSAGTGVGAVLSFSFFGVVAGDNHLSPGGDSNVWSGLGVMVRNLGYFDTATSTINFFSGDYFDLGVLASDLTLVFGSARQAPQIKVIRAKQSPSGTLFKLNWPTDGSVVWAGGEAPPMTQAYDAVDFYVLYSQNGNFWYGTSLGIGGTPPSAKFVQIGPATPVANSTVEASLLSSTFTPITKFGTSTIYRIKASGVVSNDVTSGQLTIRLKVAGQVVASNVLASIASAKTNQPWIIDGVVGINGNSVWAQLFGRFEGGNVSFVATKAVATDITGFAHTMNLTAQWASALSGNSIVCSLCEIAQDHV